jgi:hypothetical protein
MSFRSLETEVLAELRTVAGKKGIRLKDIMEWSTGDVKTIPGEAHFFLPNLEVNVAVATEALGKKFKAKESKDA